MSDPNERDSKLVQYLNEAYAKERELESALVEQIEAAARAVQKKRLKKLAKETKAHVKTLERRIKKLGGKGALADVPVKKRPAVKGGEQEKKLGAATNQYVGAHEKISTYLRLETFATKVGDGETAKIARDIRRDVERMAKSLEGQIKSLANAVAIEVVPASLRRSKSKPNSRRGAAEKAAAAKAPKAAAKSAPASKAKKSAKKASAKSSKPKAASKAKRTAKPKSAKKAAAGK